MGRTTSPLLPVTERLVADLGERLRLARKRRKLTALQVAERAGMAPMTLRAVEQGSPGATLGAYLAVMQVLGLQADLSKVAAEDTLGRALQDASLEKKPRLRSTTFESEPYAGPVPHDRPGRQVHRGTVMAVAEATSQSGRPQRAAELLGLLKRRPAKDK